MRLLQLGGQERMLPGVRVAVVLGEVAAGNLQAEAVTRVVEMIPVEVTQAEAVTQEIQGMDLTTAMAAFPEITVEAISYTTVQIMGRVQTLEKTVEAI